MKILPPYTQKQLEAAGMTKGQLIERMIEAQWWHPPEEVHDMALPQGWLDWFVEETGLDYHLVLGTTAWVYCVGELGGRPISGCVEVQEQIDRKHNLDKIRKTV